MDRIIYAFFNRFHPQWKNRILQMFTQAAGHLPTLPLLESAGHTDLWPFLLARLVKC